MAAVPFPWDESTGGPNARSSSRPHRFSVSFECRRHAGPRSPGMSRVGGTFAEIIFFLSGSLPLLLPCAAGNKKMEKNPEGEGERQKFL